MQIDLQFILLLLLNGLVGLSFFILAIVFFFVEARDRTQSISKPALLISTLLCAAGILNALMTRYSVVFPKISGYDMNSDFTFITNLITAAFNFFVTILYIRCGQYFAEERERPGSCMMKAGAAKFTMDWKWILLFTPLLILWTFLWFGIFPPEPTDLALATTPEGNSLMVYIYTFFTASILAPVKEEILYRHFAMGLLYKWFGRSKAAVALNIAITAMLFAIAHVGIVTEDWIKILQIFPAGLLFGWINHKQGLEHSILAHSAFNTLVIPVSMIIERLAM